MNDSVTITVEQGGFEQRKFEWQSSHRNCLHVLSEGDQQLKYVPDSSPLGFFSLTLCSHVNETELWKLWQAIFKYWNQVYSFA